MRCSPVFPDNTAFPDGKGGIPLTGRAFVFTLQVGTSEFPLSQRTASSLCGGSLDAVSVGRTWLNHKWAMEKFQGSTDDNAVNPLSFTGRLGQASSVYACQSHFPGSRVILCRHACF